MKTFLVFWIPLFFLAGELHGENKVSVIDLQSSKAQQALISSLKKEKDWVIVPSSETEKAIRENLQKILGEEITLSMEDYYNFRFESAIIRLQGRKDVSALKWLSLIHFAQGLQKETHALWEELLSVKPRAGFSSRDFPPTFIQDFIQFKKEKKKHNGPFLKINKEIILSQNWEGWDERFLKLAKEKGWKAVLIHSLHQIGWNYKWTASLFLIHGKKGRTITRAVEMESLDDLPRASKVLVKSLFLLTPLGD